MHLHLCHCTILVKSVNLDFFPTLECKWFIQYSTVPKLSNLSNISYLYSLFLLHIRKSISSIIISWSVHILSPFMSSKTSTHAIMNSMKIIIPLHFISLKKTPNDAVTLQRQSQFTPKMKANAVPCLLSSLVWIDQYNECSGMTSFMEFMGSAL